MNLSKEVKVGLLAVVSITVLYFGFNYLKGIDFLKPTKTYYAVYNNVAGLSVSNSVTINGFAVGRVSDIHIIQERNNQIIVSIDLNKEIVLGDSSVALLTSDFLGSTTIDLRIGDIQKPMRDGDTLIGQLDKGIAEILEESALTMGDNVQLTIRRINAILDSLAGSSGDIRAMLSNAKDISGDVKDIIRQNKETVTEITVNTKNFTVQLNELVASMKPILANFNQIADTLNSLELSRSLAKVNGIFDRLTVTVDKLNRGEGSMGKLLNDDSLYINLNRTIVDLDKVLIHLDEEPKHFFKPLGRKKKKKKKE